jgi:hypothetical protein
MDTSSTNEIEATAGRLIGLDLQLRRHHYHSSDENAEPLDLIDMGAITNLEWDEKDGLWVQLDDLITFDITPTGSSICIYLDEEPVVTLWASPGSSEKHWTADWETDLTASERQHFLRRVGVLGKESTERVVAAVDRLRAETESSEDRAFVASTVREWLSAR